MAHRGICKRWTRSLRLAIAGMVLGWIGGAANAADVRVVATILPIHSLAAGVMAGAGAPSLLIKGAASPHRYALRPSEAEMLANADVIFWIGDGLETFLAKALAALPEKARVVALHEAPGLRLLPYRVGGPWAEDDHGEEDHAHAHDQEHDHDHAAGQDMHIWLDPRNAKAMVGAIAETLAAADPDRSALYHANAAALVDRLGHLDKDLERTLAPVAGRPFIVFHDAYQYLEDRYGLKGAGAIAFDPDRQPGAQRLAQIRGTIATAGAACVFAEPQFPPALVKTVTDGTPARTAALDPLGAGLAPGPGAYFQLMEALARDLANCLAK